MINLDLSHTQLLPNGLRFSPDDGVLLAERRRLKLDPKQPRNPATLSEEALGQLRHDIDVWRDKRRGLAGSGIMEALKVRWEPGALDSKGNPRKNAALLVWDGGRKFRVTEDYDWVPVTLEDLGEREARAAAVRTSIFKKLLTPIEEAHAFEQDIKDEKLSLQQVANKYNLKSKSYVANRIDLLKLPLDVQQWVSDHPEMMSHALAMRKVKDKGTRAELLSMAEHGASVKEIEGEIAKETAQAAAVKEAYTPPTTHDQQRQAIAESNGSAPTSRGVLLTGETPKDATEKANEYLTEATGKMLTALSWAHKGGKLDPNELHRAQSLLAELQRIYNGL